MSRSLTQREFRIGSRGHTLKEKVRDFLFGLFFFELHQESLGLASKYRDSLNILMLGDFLGLPLMNSYLTLKLIPYMFGDLSNFKKRHLKEKDVFHLLAEHDVH